MNGAQIVSYIRSRLQPDSFIGHRELKDFLKHEGGLSLDLTATTEERSRHPGLDFYRKDIILGYEIPTVDRWTHSMMVVLFPIIIMLGVWRNEVRRSFIGPRFQVERAIWFYVKMNRALTDRLERFSLEEEDSSKYQNRYRYLYLRGLSHGYLYQTDQSKQLQRAWRKNQRCDDASWKDIREFNEKEYEKQIAEVEKICLKMTHIPGRLIYQRGLRDGKNIFIEPEVLALTDWKRR